KPKNDVFVKEIIMKLQKFPNLIEPTNKRIKEVLAEGVKSDTARYMRFILNEDVIAYDPAKEKPKKKAAKTAANSEPKEEAPDPMEEILKLSNKLNNN
ncbi:hypothetical protein HNQ00_003253, partial [Flavobacterium sp. 14A]|nr:hypothetical protein [Flavobacterium sp. 14A]